MMATQFEKSALPEAGAPMYNPAPGGPPPPGYAEASATPGFHPPPLNYAPAPGPTPGYAMAAGPEGTPQCPANLCTRALQRNLRTDRLRGPRWSTCR